MRSKYICHGRGSERFLRSTILISTTFVFKPAKKIGDNLSTLHGSHIFLEDNNCPDPLTLIFQRPGLASISLKCFNQTEVPSTLFMEEILSKTKNFTIFSLKYKCFPLFWFFVCLFGGFVVVFCFGLFFFLSQSQTPFNLWNFLMIMLDMAQRVIRSQLTRFRWLLYRYLSLC